MWKADVAVNSAKHPKGVTLKTNVRFLNRLVLEASIEHSPSSLGEPMSLVGRIVNKLLTVQ